MSHMPFVNAFLSSDPRPPGSHSFLQSLSTRGWEDQRNSTHQISRNRLLDSLEQLHICLITVPSSLSSLNGSSPNSNFSPLVRRSTDSPRQPGARPLRGFCGKLRSNKPSYRLHAFRGTGARRWCGEATRTGEYGRGLVSPRGGGGAGLRTGIGDEPTTEEGTAFFCHCRWGSLGVG